MAPLPQVRMLLNFHKRKLIVVAGTGAYKVSNYRQCDEIGQLSSSIFAASAAQTGNALWLYATTQKGKVFVSENGGRDWRETTPSLGQSAGKFQAIAVSEQHAKVAYVGFRGLQLGAGKENLFNGIAKTEDAGKTWHIVLKNRANLRRTSKGPGLSSAPHKTENRSSLMLRVRWAWLPRIRISATPLIFSEPIERSMVARPGKR